MKCRNHQNERFLVIHLMDSKNDSLLDKRKSKGDT